MISGYGLQEADTFASPRACVIFRKILRWDARDSFRISLGHYVHRSMVFFEASPAYCAAILHACQSRCLVLRRILRRARGVPPGCSLIRNRNQPYRRDASILCDDRTEDEGREEADGPFRMLDRAADIRYFGNITRKGAPGKSYSSACFPYL